MTYKNLSYLIGQDVHEIRHIPEKSSDEVIEPIRITVINEYEKTLLVRKIYPHGSYLRTINKNSMFCGDVKLFWHGHELTGKEIIA